MTPTERDDLNHLLLSCRMRGELSAGIRYAYARLDTIDRKSSELFRSFTFITGGLIALCALVNRNDLWARVALGPIGPGFLALTFLVSIMVTLTIALILLTINIAISNLRFHRIRTADLDAGELQGEPLSIDDARPAVRKVLEGYLTQVSKVTVQRERRLKLAVRLYEFGFVFALFAAVCVVAMGLFPLV